MGSISVEARVGEGARVGPAVGTGVGSSVSAMVGAGVGVGWLVFTQSQRQRGG